jgi:hypothetical protein
MENNAIKQGVRTTYTEAEVRQFICDKKASGKSFRKIALEDYQGQITHSVVQKALQGQFPTDPIKRKVLGLSEHKNVTVIFGEVPDGTQVIQAQLCECGQFFISNHPRRSKCFICSPYKKGKSHA